MKNNFWLMFMILAARLQAQETFSFGATTNVPGGKLVFENASGYVTNSDFCFSTAFGTPHNSLAGGYYNNSQIFSALTASDPNAAALGTVIQIQLLNVEGPAGASLGFWEGNGGVTGTNLTWSVPVPSAGNTNLIRVTEAPDSATNNPYGDILGRVLTFSKPGLYKITWQLVDTSTNGSVGTPQDLPSDPFTIYYQADVTIENFSMDANNVYITIAAINPNADPNLYYNILQSSSVTQDPSTWPSFVNIYADGKVHTLTVPRTSGAAVEFFRIQVQTAYVGS
jgi:hypothetical protein